MNGCNAIITRGKNRGKKCKDIHKYCHNIAHRDESITIITPIIEVNSNKNEYCLVSNDKLYINANNSLISVSDSFDPELNCKYCNKTFSHKTHMYRHQKHRCKSKNSIINHDFVDEDMIKNHTMDINELDDIDDDDDDIDNNDYTYNTATNSKSSSSKSKHSKKSDNTTKGNYTKIINTTTINTSVNNNFIQIICVGKNDDFYKILSARMGEKEAGEYILNCAKNNIDGDINLLKKIYFEGKSPAEYPIKFLDKSRKKVQFLNENKELYVDPSGSELARRLCSSLQNGYLLQVNQIIEANYDQKDDGKFMDEFDIYNCHNHIYELSDKTYRKKLITSLGDTLGTYVVQNNN